MSGRTKRRIDGCASEHRRDIWGQFSERHNRMGVSRRCVGEFLQGVEGLLVVECKDILGAEDSRNKGYDTIEEGGILCEVVGILRWILQTLLMVFVAFDFSPSSHKNIFVSENIPYSLKAVKYMFYIVLCLTRAKAQ